MKIQSLIPALLFSIFSISAFAQTGKLTGQVLDKDEEPLQFTTIVVYEGDLTRFGTQTDENGEFRIDSVQQGIYRVEARYLGSKLSITDVTIMEGYTREVRLKFKEDVATTLYECHGIMALPVFSKDATVKRVYKPYHGFFW